MSHLQSDVRPETPTTAFTSKSDVISLAQTGQNTIATHSGTAHCFCLISRCDYHSRCHNQTTLNFFKCMTNCVSSRFPPFGLRFLFLLVGVYPPVCVCVCAIQRRIVNVRPCKDRNAPCYNGRGEKW